MNKLKRFLLSDLEENLDQSSWDWEADYRFAIAAGDTKSAEIIKEAIDSSAPTALRFVLVRSTGITKKRLRVMNGLIKMKLVTAYWLGTGDGGRSEFGISRVKIYTLSTSVRKTK